ncbi:MAG: hypothetical protein EZS28_004819 [Streblomastix strix]|uniref:Uncharacterized protein n=1 Tax=Streblomastix strix TaxID=222440 RepID=A0A5J4WYU8_9EUKA|nr:MAG: hypothetical protein EZS28_004819 [Streblomastix strix]
MKAARREDPEDLFIKMEKRSQDKENTQPTKSQDSTKGAILEHILKAVIDMDQGSGNDDWNEPFQGFPERLNEPHRQQGARNVQISEIMQEINASKEQDQAGSGQLIYRCDDLTER